MKTRETRTATISLPPALLAELDREAEAQERTRSWITAKAIKEFLQRRAAAAQREGNAP